MPALVKTPEVAIWATEQTACIWYRIAQPAEAMVAEKFPVRFLPSSVGDKTITEAIAVADVFARWRTESKSLSELQRTARNRGEPAMVMDTDDDIFNIDPQSPHYPSWGTQEGGVTDGKEYITVWKDGETIDIAGNRKRVARYIKALRSARAVTTTTERLRERLLKYNPCVKVLPNCVNTGLLTPYLSAKCDIVRIGYQGDVSHTGDIRALENPLEKHLSAYRNSMFVVAGALGPVMVKKLKGMERPCLEWHPQFVPILAHYYRMMWLQLDMMVIPLKDTEFNRARSCVKFYEAAAMGVPCVMSNVPPYADEVTDGETGLLVENTDKGWYDGITRLARDRTLRKRLGDNARDWVVANRDARKCAHLWWDFYNELYQTGYSGQGLCA